MTDMEALEALAYDKLGKIDPQVIALMKAAFDMGQRTPANAQDVELYSADQQRVADFLVSRSNGQIGAGWDPIGFLMSSYDYVHKIRPERSNPQQQELWDYCENFIRNENIFCGEVIYDRDSIIVNAYEFIEGVCDIVGYVPLADAG